MTGLDVNGVTKTFASGEGGNTIVAVNDLDLNVRQGEFLVLLGPSGCGKSTTLRCISGLETPTEGEIALDGRDVTEEKPQNRDMAMVFQDFALYPHMTARENMSFGLKMTTDLSADERDRRVDEAADIMDIGDLLGKKPAQLSGGQKQRVALGRAVVRDPAVFLMDEPLSNLDAKLRTQMRTEIQRLHQQIDVTTIYVTHDQTEAMTMSDRVAILNDGELQQIGAPDEVYDHPANLFVAGFIGSPSMNFIEGEVRERDGSFVFVSTPDATQFTYTLPAEIAERLDVGAGDVLTVGVRPEDIDVSSADAEGSDYRAEVDVVEPMGSDNYLYLNVGRDTWTARVESDIEPDAGSEVTYTFDDHDVHLFASDGETLKSKGMPHARTDAGDRSEEGERPVSGD
ncbi:ABC transporter ATP-binding protein [Halomicrococcus sp. SG-WS-1]|uniref:ABC transporter ATP-binding protein n=1 Tax=Halomicrococcus sp. SG-WS-1 TaxID=3439057 RepID=UPI003F7B322F